MITMRRLCEGLSLRAVLYLRHNVLRRRDFAPLRDRIYDKTYPRFPGASRREAERYGLPLRPVQQVAKST